MADQANTGKTAQAARLDKELQVIYHTHPNRLSTDIYFNHHGELTQGYQEFIPDGILQEVRQLTNMKLAAKLAPSNSPEQELLQLMSSYWPQAIISLTPHTLCLSVDASQKEVLTCIDTTHQLIEQVYGIYYQLVAIQAKPQE